jgi:hypothetical protein
MGGSVMNDRELLEAAAKAAGYWSHEFNCPDKLPTGAWNPLTDDGDALRLAALLRISVYHPPSGGAFGISANGKINCVENESASATRRAIVRAAAAVTVNLI